MKKSIRKYTRKDRHGLAGDLRLNHRQRVLMYADISSIGNPPSNDELRRLYAILYHARDVSALSRFAGRFDLDALYPDPISSLPHVSEHDIDQEFRYILKVIRKVNPAVKKVPSRINDMAPFPYPGRKYYRGRQPGAPSLTNYFYTSDDGAVYFLKRTFLEDQSKKWLLSFARKYGIFVTTPRMIKGTQDDISLDGLILQILAGKDHETFLIEAMQRRKPALSAEDADALLAGEYIIIDM